MSDSLPLIATVIGATATATWVIRSQISELAKTLAAHVASDTERFKALEKAVFGSSRRRRPR